ncbi:MAG: pyridoxine 5'-phosphate synthase [Gammaproteobacteria bacterium]|nr:pyridoxine 5'-phosphate synthase [Gammaproteobacteria bacterium]
MTKLSVNLNKIAWIRNSRGRDYPNVVDYAKKFIDLGVHGITVHPRPDERHIKIKDVYDLTELLSSYSEIEFNVEGYPSDDFMALVKETKPDQCTLVPDAPGQLTSDHGWQVTECQDMLIKAQESLEKNGIRSALFLDPDLIQIEASAKLKFERIELYTEHFADTFQSQNAMEILDKYKKSAGYAESLGLGVNAGHDLDLSNLGTFLRIGNILEVSIGHALTVECLDLGMPAVVKQYLQICNGHNN